jgi:hypothetical protein
MQMPAFGRLLSNVRVALRVRRVKPEAEKCKRMEQALNKAETATEAAQALQNFFVNLLVRGNNKDLWNR